MVVKGSAGISPIKYLEIGSWKGSTFCSAIANNSIFGVSIDNFSEFTNITINGNNTPSSLALKQNISYVHSISRPQSWMNVHCQDCFSIDPSSLGGLFDVYFYDGEHSYESQYKAFTHFNSCLSKICIILVDDYAIDVPNAPREATQKAFHDLGYLIHKDWYLFGGNDTVAQASLNWWNGVYVAIIEKR